MNVKKEYKNEVKAGLVRVGSIKPDIITESDLQHLPLLHLFCKAL
jgi:hypothetical protein